VSRWIVVIVVLAVLCGGLVWMTRSRRPEELPAMAPEAARAKVETPPSPAAVPPPAAAPPPAVSDVPKAADTPSPPSGTDPGREVDVRRKITAVLDRYPGVATLRKLECQPTGACSVEMEVRDLNAFATPLERLQEPESGLSGDHAMMVLSRPEPIGPNGGAPFLFKFHVTPPEGGVR
jgi:hypothetical protein